MKRFENVTFCLLLALIILATNVSLAEEQVSVNMNVNSVNVSRGQKRLLCYRYEDVPYKPYVQKLYSPNGINILRDAPHDHLHHHALMYAVAVDGLNFWEEQKEPGRQQHKRFNDMKVSVNDKDSGAGFTEQINWINPGSKELMLKESRTISVCQLKEDKATLLSWQSKFAVPMGKKSVTLTGSHYFGLGMRFTESMDKGGEFYNSADQAGEIVRGDERITRADWCAFTAKADGKDVTVVIFGHPENIRHPTHWFTMSTPFAYLAATLNLYKQPLDVVKDKPLVLKYAVAVWDGRVEKSKIDKVYRSWVKSQ